jgi:hypothetical protein
MKKLLILIFLIIISCLKINAQEFRFGFLAGFDFTRIHNIWGMNVHEYGRYDPMVSFNINGYIGFKSSEFWGFSFEPGFIQKGGILENKYLFQEQRQRVENNYIQLPVLADFYLTQKVFLSVGPEFAFWLNSPSNGNKFEVSGLAGLNYQITKKIDVGLRYSHALTYSVKTEEIYFDYGLISKKQYNQYLQLIVRFKF